VHILLVADASWYVHMQTYTFSLFSQRLFRDRDMLENNEWFGTIDTIAADSCACVRRH
jgi:hypothetical protein